MYEGMTGSIVEGSSVSFVGLPICEWNFSNVNNGQTQSILFDGVSLVGPGMPTSSSVPTPTTSSTSSFSLSDAQKIANQIPIIQQAWKSDPNFSMRGNPQPQTDSSGLAVYLVQFGDNTPSQWVTLYNVDVRSDGMVEDGTLQNGWYTPSTIKLQ